MNYFQLTMRIASGLIMLYFLLIMLRIIFSWIPQNSASPLRNFVIRFTDPYMKRFQGIRWLRFGMLDFSPILGLGLLSFLLFITQRLSVDSLPRMGEIIVWIIQMVWSIAAFLALILALAMLFRLFTLYSMATRRPWMDSLDNFLFPKVAKIIGIFTGKTISYKVALGISAFLLLLLRFLIGLVLKRYLYPLLYHL